MRMLREKGHSRDGVLGLAALIVAVAALVVAVVGPAGAAPTQVIIHKGDIAPGAVTAKALAKGSVTKAKLRKHSVTWGKLSAEAVHAGNLAPESIGPRTLGKESVGTSALARNAVTASQLAPGSVYGGALGAQTLVTKPIADLDTIAHNGEWTASNTEAALCGPGEKLLSPGFAFDAPANGQAIWLQAYPILNGDTIGVTGRMVTDSGGTVTGTIAALCLK
jgi:hypothetical protein